MRCGEAVAVGMDVDVAVGVVMVVVVDRGTGHGKLLYYNIMGVQRSLRFSAAGGVTNSVEPTAGTEHLPSSRERSEWRGGVGGGGCFSEFAVR
jgi:hypothetical protein